MIVIMIMIMIIKDFTNHFLYMKPLSIDFCDHILSTWSVLST